MDSHRLRQFSRSAVLDLLRDFEAYCPSLARASQPRSRDGGRTQHQQEPTKRPATARPSEGSTSSSSDSDAGERTTGSPSSQQYGDAKLAAKTATSTHGSGRRIHLLPDHPVFQKPKTANPKQNQSPTNRLSRFTTLQRAGENCSAY
ncbi:hypothetical protein EVAR_43294_1 [Eumeta japonica]|uniref:Uncharacterized protein n=1 Tax=Eumeta variegata TaxID=151549 RepID=A0A4C1X219_EUMVA|nr:hypothetical protein EVAR_43294_1 [Eumeta japonica]